MSVSPSRALLAAVVLLIGAVAVTAAQPRSLPNTLRVEFHGISARPAVVGVFRRDGVLYASANDLASVLGMPAADRSGSLELSSAQARFRLTPSNPFVVVVEGSHTPLTLQLPAEVLHAAGSYFVPLEGFLAVAGSRLPAQVEYDERTGVLRVSRTWTPAVGYDITGVKIDAKVNGTAIRIPLSRKMQQVEHWLRSDGWLYVTIMGARADTAALNDTKPEGLVRRVLAIQSAGSVQLSFKLTRTPESVERSRDAATGDLILALRTPVTSARPNHRTTEPDRAGLEQKRERWAMDVVVIDPGHGGRDPGSIGVTGVKEKDITLGIGRKLGALIKKSLSGVRVVYTRSDDRFIELDRRGRIANANDGKLFISIHCNSLPHKPSPPRGFEVYLLRPGRTNEAVSIATRENAVIQMEEGYEKRYAKLTDENFILVTMAQSAYVKSSEVFADLLQREMENRAGIPNRGVKQAGFYVLVGASMPNVLVETAYLSNREDERFLNSQSGQQKIAESILSAVRKYKQQYEKLLDEGRVIGQR